MRHEIIITPQLDHCHMREAAFGQLVEEPRDGDHLLLVGKPVERVAGRGERLLHDQGADFGRVELFVADWSRHGNRHNHGGN